MRTRVGRFCLEFLIVIGLVMALKIWFFPLLISFWFPARLVADHLMEWTVLIIGVMMMFIYLGLGSSGKQTHGLSLWQATAVFSGLHLLFFIQTVSVIDQFYLYWKDLIGDLLALFFPKQTIHDWHLVIIYFILFLAGRGIQVKEEKTEEHRDNQKSSIPLNEKNL
jgi:hypothetical protein